MLWNSGAAEWPGVPSALRSGLSIMMPMTYRGLSTVAIPAKVIQ